MDIVPCAHHRCTVYYVSIAVAKARYLFHCSTGCVQSAFIHTGKISTPLTARTTLRASTRLPPKTLNIVTRAVLPAAVGRLLKHWEILDKAAGEGRGFLRTLQTLLRVQVSDEDNTAAPIGAEDAFFHRGGGSSTSTSSTPSRDVDLCRWIMSQSLTSQEAFSRPSLAGRASGVGDHAWSRIREPGSTTSSSGAFSRQRQPPPDEELTSRVIRAYRAFAAAGLFGSRGSGDALRLAAGLWSTVLCLPEGLRPASEHRASLALRLAIDLGLPTISGTASSTRNARTSSGGGGGSGGRDAGTSLVHMGEDAGVQHAASVLAGLLDVHPVERAEVGGAHGGDTKSSATGGRRVAGGATRGALFYRRFSEPIHEALLKRGGKVEVVHSQCVLALLDWGDTPSRKRRRVGSPGNRCIASL